MFTHVFMDSICCQQTYMYFALSFSSCFSVVGYLLDKFLFIMKSCLISHHGFYLKSLPTVFLLWAVGCWDGTELSARGGNPCLFSKDACSNMCTIHYKNGRKALSICICQLAWDPLHCITVYNWFCPFDMRNKNSPFHPKPVWTIKDLSIHTSSSPSNWTGSWFAIKWNSAVWK